MHQTHHLELTVADAPLVLDRVVSLFRARRCAIRELRFEAADRHRPGRVYVTVDADGRAELISMYVHPDARATGVAGELVEAVAAWATDQGATELVLSVKRANERARRLYLRHGFEDHGEEGDEPDEQRLRRPL